MSLFSRSTTRTAIWNRIPSWWQGRTATYPTLGGYATMAGYCREVRAERHGAVILLDNGDTFHGTHPVVQSKGEAILPLLDALGFDAMTGHWDFAYGPAHLKFLVSRPSCPMLAINCYANDTGELTFPPTQVVERGGLRVGIIGIAATIVDKTMPRVCCTDQVVGAGCQHVLSVVTEVGRNPDARVRACGSRRRRQSQPRSLDADRCGIADRRR